MIVRVGDRLKPCVFIGFRIALNGKMCEPVVGGCSVPVIDIRGDFNHIAGQQFPCLSAAFLVKADAADCDQKLSSGMERGTPSRLSFVNGARYDFPLKYLA